MTDSSAIDGFLAASLRALRANEEASWALDKEWAWQQVWERIEYHGIPFLLHSSASQLQTWPSDLLDRIAEEARLVILWETTHHKAVSEIVEALDTAGIACVIMKGTALAYSFHDEPATRRRGDTDLLIHPQDKQRAREIFERMGWYRHNDPHGLYYQEGWLHDTAGFFEHAIDLHWAPSDRPTLQQSLPIRDFFANKVAMPRFGTGAFRPNLALMVLHATINQKWHAEHGYASEAGFLTSPRRLIWSVDFDLLIRNMKGEDWQALYELCDQHTVGALVAEALRGVSQDLRTSVSEDTLERLARVPLDPALEAYLKDWDSLTHFWADLRKAQGVTEKARLLTMRAFPPRHHLLVKYPAAKRWPTALLQGRLLLETAQRMIRRARPQ
ncbi:MAG: nucleotidyltransferase family protein [Pseudomonadota bacterium]